MLSQFLSRYNLKYEDLNSSEKETLIQWSEALSKKTITVNKIKDHLDYLIKSLEKDLTELEKSTSLWTAIFNWKRDYYLKARLKNYLLLQDFLTSPEKAQAFIEQSISNLKK